MWLPPDERRLLAGLVGNGARIDDEEAYHKATLAKLLYDPSSAIQAYGYESEVIDSEAPDIGQLKVAIQKTIADDKRVSAACSGPHFLDHG